MLRYSMALASILVGLGLVPAHAEHWLRVLPSEKPHSGAYRWFDVDSVVHDKKSGMVLVHLAAITADAMRGGKAGTWTVSGVRLQGQESL